VYDPATMRFAKSAHVRFQEHVLGLGHSQFVDSSIGVFLESDDDITIPIPPSFAWPIEAAF
jgi:hypothetical protein